MLGGGRSHTKWIFNAPIMNQWRGKVVRHESGTLDDSQHDTEYADIFVSGEEKCEVDMYQV